MDPVTPPAPEVILRLSGVTVRYPGRRTGWRRAPAVPAVDDVSLELRRGEVLGLVGESGCGKSSLAKAVVRLIRPDAGAILFEGTDIARMGEAALKPLRSRIQMVFQDPYSSLNPRVGIGTAIAEALAIHGLHPERPRERVAELLELVGLQAEMAGRYPHEFSGGQRQRVGIARALAVEPSLLVCDEPTSALDVSVQAQILNLLGDLRERLGLSLLFISHNLPAVAMFAHRIAVMERGRVVELGTPAALQAAPSHPYTRALLSAVPIADPRLERNRARILLPADAVPAGDGGCAFRPRCWLNRQIGQPARCAEEAPTLREIDAGHWARCHFAESTAVAPVALQHPATPYQRGYLVPAR